MNRRSVLLGSAAAVIASPARADGWLESIFKIFSVRTPSGDASPGAEDVREAIGTLTVGDVTAGLKQALELSTDHSISKVGRPDGYFKDMVIHIPLPQRLMQAQKMMANFGLSGMLDDLELRLNRAAEMAAPYAKELFVTAIASMTLDDAMGILKGPNDAATRYFEDKMTPQLRQTFRPVISQQLEKSGAFRALDDVNNGLANIPLASSVQKTAKDSLIDHGLEYALDGLFHYVAKEEAAIRTNPAKRTTDLLKKVFK